MANSFVRYTGDNSTTAYSIPFSYRATGDLTVTLAGSATTAFTLNAAGTTLTFSSPPASNVAIEIRRTTSQTTRLTDYASGSVLTENDLDTDSEQAFFMSQEAIDDADDVIKISNTDFQYDAGNKQIRNVANPTSNQDVATKHYLENTWLSTANKTALTTVNANIANINAVNSNSSNINSAVSNATNINTVATNIGSVNTVATDIAKVITVANDLAEAVSEVETVADDLNETSSEIEVVGGAITNVNTVGTNITNVNTVAGINSDVTSVAGISSDIQAINNIKLAISNVSSISPAVSLVNGNSANINTVAGNNSNISTVAGISGNVTTVAGISSDVTSVANDATDIGTVAGISSDVTSVAGISSAVSAVNSNSSNINAVNSNSANINTVAGNNTNINTVAGVSSDVTTVAGISSDVQAVENIASNVTTVAGMSTAINTVNSNSSNVNTVAGAITNVNNVGGSIANVNTVAGNLSGVNSFGERYRVSSSAPTTSLDVGDLYYDTATDAMKVYGSSGWQNAGSSVNGTSQRYNYTATNAQTTFTGADNNGNTLTYDAGYIDVYLNGVKLLNGTDVTVTSGSSVVLASGATTGDVVDIVAYGTFSVASLNADNLDSGTVPDARITGAYTGITSATINAGNVADSTPLIIKGGETDLSPLPQTVGMLFGYSGASGYNKTGLINEFETSAGLSALHIVNNSTANSSDATKSDKRITIDYNGDISFYEDTGTTPKLFWDASTERLGIGTTSPQTALHIDANVPNIRLTDDAVSTSANARIDLYGSDARSGYVGMLSGNLEIWHEQAKNIRFATSNTEHMRINSSGDVFVSKTARDTTDGIELRNDGKTVLRVTGDTPLTLDRKTNEGTMISFRRNDTETSKIATVDNGNIAIGAGTAGILFTPTGNHIRGFNTTAFSSSDNTIDIGRSSTRFKDLYLAGGLYVGGTGTANKLDDYEEGTWTPAVGSGGITITTVTNANYVKVGGQVTATCYISIQGGDSSLLQITGLPVASGTNNYAVNIADFGKGGFKGAYGRVNANSTNIEFFVSSENTSTNRTQIAGNQVGTGYFIFSITYLTT